MEISIKKLKFAFYLTESFFLQRHASRLQQGSCKEGKSLHKVDLRARVRGVMVLFLVRSVK